MAMFEIGDVVMIISTQEVRRVVGIGPGEFFMVQLGNDESSVKPVKGGNLELVSKAPKSH
jgi:hypothetical protein